MKLALILIGATVVSVLIYFFYLGVQSKSAQTIRLKRGVLSRCAEKPNCVCSEYHDDEAHYIAAIPYSQSQSEAIHLLEQIILEMGGELWLVEENYIAATFTSSVFGFVDDFELRVDRETQLIHIRSASRVGYQDGGINRKRVTKFVKTFLENKKKGNKVVAKTMV